MNEIVACFLVHRLMNKRIAGSKLVTIRGAGYLANIEQPEAFNEAVMSFLDSLG